MSILEVNNVSKSFGGVKANVDISMSVEKGKIVDLQDLMDQEKLLYLIQQLALIQQIMVQLSLMEKKYQNYLSQ